MKFKTIKSNEKRNLINVKIDKLVHDKDIRVRNGLMRNTELIVLEIGGPSKIKSYPNNITYASFSMENVLKNLYGMNVVACFFDKQRDSKCEIQKSIIREIESRFINSDDAEVFFINDTVNTVSKKTEITIGDAVVLGLNPGDTVWNVENRGKYHVKSVVKRGLITYVYVTCSVRLFTDSQVIMGTCGDFEENWALSYKEAVNKKYTRMKNALKSFEKEYGDIIMG